MVLKLGQFLKNEHDQLDDRHKHYIESAVVAKEIVEKDRKEKKKASFLSALKEKLFQ